MTKRIFVLAFTVEGDKLHPPSLVRLVYRGLEGVYGAHVRASDVTFIDETIANHPVETWVREQCEKNIAGQAVEKPGAAPPSKIEQDPDQDT
jgi:hypothetical protein